MTLNDPMLLQFVNLAMVAGREIMAIYETDFAAQKKADSSPVTEADQRAEAVIIAGLKSAYPEIPVIAEEQAAAGNLPEISSRFFLVDPLDGTREFISRNGEFTVNIALIENSVPVVGVVFAPAINDIFVGSNSGAARAVCQAYSSPASLVWQTIATRPAPSNGLTVIASRSHRDAETDAFLKTQDVRELISAGSSLKFCRIAAGDADLYPRFGRTMEWDTAAGQAVLEAAGGNVSDANGNPFRYGKSIDGFANPAFIARGKI